MVKSRAVLGVLAVMGILALSATVAQAGDGGRPSPLTSFFVCHSISGGSPDKVVDVESPVFGPNRLSVKIGNGTLACALARLFTPGNLGVPSEEITPNPTAVNDPQIKCYTVSVAKKTSGPALYTATDVLSATVLSTVGSPGILGIETGIQATEIRYICGPATFFRQ